MKQPDYSRLRRLYFPESPLVEPGEETRVSAIDGIRRKGERERYLNAVAARVFLSGGGKEILDYLKDITIHRVADFGVSDEALRQLEGARWLVSVIQQRITAGKQQGEVHHASIPLS